MINPIFINTDIQVFYDTQARNFLSQTNDKRFLQNGEITQVPISRWNEAQSYEEKTWMVNGINEHDDRNYDHLIRFDNYMTVPFDDIQSFIELGCGPFTNTRLIIDRLPMVCKIDLLDPLIDKYKNHPNCTYKNNMIGDKNIRTINSSIEDLDTTTKYNCILINNVLEHCYNVHVIFDKILNILSNNGTLIFSDVCFSKSSISELCENIYDAGHPIRISKDSVDLFLQQFKPLFHEEIYGLYNQAWRIDKYFIGQKY